jgi:predicted permease
MILQNLNYSFRQLRKSPGFALTAILTLALGIGANTAVFSVTNAVLLRSLPISDPNSVYNLLVPGGQPLGAFNTGNSDTSLSYPVYQALKSRTDVFSDVIASAPLEIGKVNVRIGDEPELASGELVSANFFSALGVGMSRGRGFTAVEDAGNSPVAVISYSFWTRRFNRSPDAVGQTLYVKGVPMTIVGISAEGFSGLQRAPLPTDFWVPFQHNPTLNVWGQAPREGKTFWDQPDWWCLLLSARLAPGVTSQQAIVRVTPLVQTTARIGMGTPKPGEHPTQFSMEPARGLESFSDDYRRPLYLLMSLVALVLLIACANIAMLLIARNQVRQREFSLRLAVGAGRSHLFWQLLTESLLLVTGGGVFGWLFAGLGTRALAAWSGIESGLQPDGTVLAFTLAILVLLAILFGLAPLRSALSAAPGAALKASASTLTADRHKRRFGRLVVTMQMALCIVLMVSAGLLLRTLNHLENVPVGMRLQGLVVFGVTPQGLQTQPQVIAFYRSLLTRLRPLSGVESITLVENRPGTSWSDNEIARIDGRVPDAGSDPVPPMRINAVGPDFFHVMGIPVLLGRGLLESDTETSQKVAVINQTFAERYLPNQNPLGHRLGHAHGDRTIVGVVSRNKYTSLREKDTPMAWYPFTQMDAEGVSAMHVEMHVAGDPLAVLPAAAKAVHDVDPNLALVDPRTQKDQFEESINNQRLFSRLSIFFGLLAGFMVAIGLYGTLAYRATNRTREIAVRLAVGAQREQVLWMMLRESLVLVLGAIAVGLPLAFGTALLLRSMLFGVGFKDPLSYLAALVSVTAVALLASLLPARRAAAIDPMRALRSE